MNDFQPNQDICLVPYYPAYEIALPWYQDAELCHHVDNQNRIYDLSILKNMYQYLDSHGDLFYIEYKGILCGDVCLQTSGEISIVVCKEYQNRHIGRIVIGKILALAKEKKYPQCYAEGEKRSRARMMNETKLPAQYALLEALQRTDQELLKQLLDYPQFQEQFFRNAEDTPVTRFIKNLLHP